MKIDETLSKVFDMNPIEYAPVVPSNNDIIPVDETDSTPEEIIEDDYTFALTNMRNLLNTGNSALYDALEVARESENPRAFEVVGSILKQLSDMNQQLMDIHAQKQKLSGIQPSTKTDQKQVTNNNAIFVGTTDELAQMIGKLSGE